MSHGGSFSSGGGSGTVETLQGNTGGAVGPNGAGNIIVKGDGTTITVSGNPATNTLTISSGSGGTLPVSKGGTGATTLSGVLVGQGTSPIQGVALGAVSGNPLVSQGASTNPTFSANTNACRPIVVQSASIDFMITDANTFQKCTASGPMVLTIPLNASVAFPINTEIDVYQQGTGQVTISVISGVTLNSANSNTVIAAQYTGASLKKTATDTWELVGNLTS